MINNYIPQYNTPLFTDVWSNAEDFMTELEDLPFALPLFEDSNYARATYYLLYARYGNSPIANMDVNQWKYKLYSVLFQYGRAWEKRYQLQLDIMELGVEEVMLGAKEINNHAYNPNSAPSTSTLQELTYINEQNTTTRKRNVVDAYRSLWDMIKTDVTEQYLDKFQHLFKTFVAPENVVLYYDGDPEEDEEILDLGGGLW